MQVSAWRVEEIAGRYVVVDKNGFRLAYIYARDAEVMRDRALSRDEARTMAKYQAPVL